MNSRGLIALFILGGCGRVVQGDAADAEPDFAVISVPSTRDASGDEATMRDEADLDGGDRVSASGDAGAARIVDNMFATVGNHRLRFVRKQNEAKRYDTWLVGLLDQSTVFGSVWELAVYQDEWIGGSHGRDMLFEQSVAPSRVTFQSVWLDRGGAPIATVGREFSAVGNRLQIVQTVEWLQETEIARVYFAMLPLLPQSGWTYFSEETELNPLERRRSKGYAAQRGAEWVKVESTVHGTPWEVPLVFYLEDTGKCYCQLNENPRLTAPNERWDLDTVYTFDGE